VALGHARRVDLEEGDILAERFLEPDFEHALHLVNGPRGGSLSEARVPGELMHLHRKAARGEALWFVEAHLQPKRG
jgi:hypothetical protein